MILNDTKHLSTTGASTGRFLHNNGEKPFTRLQFSRKMNGDFFYQNSTFVHTAKNSVMKGYEVRQNISKRQEKSKGFQSTKTD